MASRMNIYITLDYELFLSTQTGTIDNCLIKPTSALLEKLNEYGVKATFFVDASYLLRLSQLDELKGDLVKVSSHVKALSEAGHSIQLHFHPQWLYSNYKDGRWIIDMEHYKLADMNEEDVIRYFSEAYNLLQSLSSTPISSFRAGGYSLMDYDRYAQLFKQLGITSDTSVLRGRACSSHYQNYDFTHIPQKSRYKFSSSIIKEDKSGGMIEYPISTASKNGFAITVKTYCKIKKADPSLLKKWGDGKSVGMDHFGMKERIFEYAKMLSYRSVVPASLDSGAIMLDEVVSSSLKKIQGDDIVIIGHPKNLNRLSLLHLGAFIQKYGANSFKIL